MIWRLSHRACPRAAAIADRHYNRQKIGSPQFVPPGRCLVLLAETETGQALWVTSWPFPELVKHEWPGAWMCSIFRNEGAGVASDLIRDAVAATCYRWGEAPKQGMVTFVDERKVGASAGRLERDFVGPIPNYGQTFRQARFREVGRTIDQDPLALQLLPTGMPIAAPAIGATLALAI